MVSKKSLLSAISLLGLLIPQVYGQSVGDVFQVTEVAKDKFIQLNLDGEPVEMDLMGKKIEIVGPTSEAWYLEVRVNDDPNIYRTSKKFFVSALTDGFLKKDDSPPAVRVGSEVFLNAPMNCRKTPNWVKSANNLSPIGLVPEGFRGTVKDIKKDGERIVGYQIEFRAKENEESPEKVFTCWIHAPGVSIDLSTQGTPVVQEAQCIQQPVTPMEEVVKLAEPVLEVTGNLEIEMPSKPLSAAEKCKKPTSNCDPTVPRSGRYDADVVEAANLYEVPPHLIKAQLAAETSFRGPKLENEKEKMAYQNFLKGKADDLPAQYRTYLWGRGLGQFGADNSYRYGLAWYQSEDEIKELHPSLREFEGDAFRNERLRLKYFLPGDEVEGVKLANVFDSKPSINAKAQLLRGIMNRRFLVTVKDKKGKTQTVDAAILLKQNPTEYYRVVVAAYNRGASRVENSMRAFTINQEKDGVNPVALHYVDIAFAEPPEDPAARKKADIPDSRRSYLVSHPGGRCHVYRILRLCGEADGFFTAYEKEFVRTKDGWEKRA